MEWYEIIIIIAAVLFVALVTFFSIRRKMQGKNCCSGTCSCCKASQKECPHCQCKKDLQEFIESK